MNTGFGILGRLRSAYNVFMNKAIDEYTELGGPSVGYSKPQYRPYRPTGNERSIISSIYTRAALDVASTKIRHVRVDQDDVYMSDIDSGLNTCLQLSANIDQSARAFLQDIVMSMFDEGSVAVLPIDTSVDIKDTTSFDILTMRTGKIVQWYPRHVRIDVYDDRIGEGKHKQIIRPKDKVAIIENPLYAIMNEPNSTLQRLIAKLNLLDAIDTQSGSGKLDLIIQLPYSTRTPARRKQADERRLDMESQLQGSKYGIAYSDATEKIVQLNRPAENNLLTQIEYLTRMLYSQLGMSEAIFDGTADEKTLLNYYNRTVEPIAAAIALELKRKFLSQTAQSQGQSVRHFRNLFTLVTTETLAELTDKLTRNEIVTANEMRNVIGFAPSKEPSANELRNKNLNKPSEDTKKEPILEEKVSVKEKR